MTCTLILSDSRATGRLKERLESNGTPKHKIISGIQHFNKLIGYFLIQYNLRFKILVSVVLIILPNLPIRLISLVTVDLSGSYCFCCLEHMGFTIKATNLWRITVASVATCGFQVLIRPTAGGKSWLLRNKYKYIIWLLSVYPADIFACKCGSFCVFYLDRFGYCQFIQLLNVLVNVLFAIT